MKKTHNDELFSRKTLKALKKVKGQKIAIAVHVLKLNDSESR